MATKTLVSLEEYLHTSFDGTDAEFVSGEVVERSMPDLNHTDVQQRFADIFGVLRRAGKVHPGAELRMRLAPELVRIPDYCAFRQKPTERVPTTPPFLAVEILSRDDRESDLTHKLAEYRDWGVEHIWVVDPNKRRLSVFDAAGLRSVDRFELREFDLVLTPTDLFD